LTPEARAKGRALAAQSIATKARAAYADLAPELIALREAELSFAQIAERLNADGQTMRRGTAWHPAQVNWNRPTAARKEPSSGESRIRADYRGLI
jgi:hypothetical protein